MAPSSPRRRSTSSRRRRRHRDPVSSPGASPLSPSSSSSSSPSTSSSSSRSRSRISPCSRRARRRSCSRRVGHSARPKPNRILGVFGLNYSTTRRDLEKVFSAYGDIVAVNLIENPDGRSRGYAFIKFERLKDASAARASMTDRFLHGRRIRVDYSLSSGPHPKTPGQYMGHWRSSS